MSLVRDLSTPALVRSGLIGGLATTSGVALTATSGWLIVQASTMPAILTLLVAIVCVRTFGIARPVLRYAERVRSHDAALASLADRRVRTYDALVPLTPARLGRRSRSDVLTSAVRDLDDVVDAQVRVVVPIIAAVTAAVVAIVATAVLLPAAGLVVAGVVASMVVSAALALRAESSSQVAGLEARAAASRVGALVTSNATDLQAIDAEGDAMRWLAAAHAEVRRTADTAGRIRGLGLAWQQLTTAASTAGMALVVAPAVGTAVTGPVAALLILTPLALADATTTIPDAIGAWARARAADGRLSELLAQEPAVKDDARATSRPDGEAPGEDDNTQTTLGGSVRVDHLVTRWHPSRPALPAVTLDLAEGQHLAITGANGSGKSTLLAALARHIDPVGGSYQLGGTDVLGMPLATARGNIALVDDEPHLFSSTLRENLRLARPAASDGDLAAALAGAGLRRWLEGLPDGLDTWLGSGGRGVSGGERARIALARALLSGRPLLLLDEPVAHLDHATAVAVIADLVSTSTGRTVVMVSHRGDGLDGFDRVVDMADLQDVTAPG
ncbi:MAG: thiol reductant ABC exporter subunit CydC [Dermatophilaceae bacterium]